MKKNLKSLFIIFALNLLVLGSVFAEGYHVCVASYKSLKNAQTMVHKLETQSVSSFINESKVKNESYYRVLLAKEFKKIEDARRYRDEVKNYSFVRELGMKGFWVCKGDKNLAPKTEPKPEPKKVEKPKPAPKKVEAPKPEPLPEPLPEPEPEPLPITEPSVKNEIPVPEPEPEPEPPLIIEEPQALDKNETSVLSEATPYSILVRSYKYSQFAENDCDRLKELGFNAYMLNTFDDNSFFAFNIHAGAFATKEEAEELKAKFDEAGILDTSVSNFLEIEEKVKKYDEIIANETVLFDNGRIDFPKSASESIEKLVNHFPANSNFPIQEITILDYDNYRASATKPELPHKVLALVEDEESVHSAIFGTFRDELFRKEVSLLLVNAENFPADDAVGDVETMQFDAKNGVFDCTLYENAGELVLFGENQAEKVFIRIKSKDFTKEEFISFLIDSFNDTSLVLYPQLRRTFFVLPDQNSDNSRNFICFNLKKVDSSYASERGNVAWALPIVGHSLAKTYFNEKNLLLCLGFYDLDYDFNAKNIHKHFVEAKISAEVSGSNHSIPVKSAEGWYLLNSKQREISFSTKSYVIAIDTAPNNAFTESDLANFGSDLKVWYEGTKMPSNSTEVIDAK
ncbi:SPOR domain-containing protein [uncultured Treponema sp.]|uniref:SPOR domain-containing protein n=1 Tax=uncultured Treponema sp. TaxID=162155 RepID=UPI0025DC1728|nr:SPOR domain-containing protein [uncultured Treponema sp.]